MTQLQTARAQEPKADGGSQTLARGLLALEIVGSATAPIGVAALAQQLKIHRSMAYRLVKTRRAV